MALTIVALVVLLLCIIRGWRRGVMLLIYGVAAWVFVGLFVLFVSTPLYHFYMNNEKIHDVVYDKAYPYVDAYVPETAVDDIEILDALDTLTQWFPEDTVISEDLLSGIDAGKLKMFGVEIPEEYEAVIEDIISEVAEGGETIGELAESIKEEAVEETETIRQKTVDATTETVTGYALRFLAVVTAYLLAKLICFAVKLFLMVTTEREPIKKAVHITGAVIGLIEAVLYIWLGLYFIHLIAITDFGQSLIEQIEVNPLLYIMYEHNLFAVFLSKLLGF